MCFAKSGSSGNIAPVEPKEPVIRHEANASITKNSKEDRNKGAFLQNVKTSNFGIDEQANITKKTLLGE